MRFEKRSIPKCAAGLIPSESAGSRRPAVRSPDDRPGEADECGEGCEDSYPPELVLSPYGVHDDEPERRAKEKAEAAEDEEPQEGSHAIRGSAVGSPPLPPRSWTIRVCGSQRLG